ncbi:MAG: putative immunity protein, partial [Rhodoferax sp.]
MDKFNAPEHLCTTFNKLRSAEACTEGYSKLAHFIRDQLAVTPQDYGMDHHIPLAVVAESNGMEDTMWGLRNAMCDDDAAGSRATVLRLLACDFAEHVLPLFEKKRPDDKRPHEAIRMARLFANGECTA